MAIEPEENELPKLSKEQLEKLGNQLKGKFERYKTDRLGTEQQWLRNLRQILGIYDPEFEKLLSDEQSRAYPKLTRVKCTSMIARLMSLLFPDAEKNWALKPSRRPSLSQEAAQQALDEWQAAHPEAPLTQEAVIQAVAQLATKRAANLERRIDDQLNDAAEHGIVDYPTLARQVITSGVGYSLGVLKGPMTLEQVETTYNLTPEGTVAVGTESAFRPYYQFVPVWDYYPDMSASSWDQMEGQFQHHLFAKHRLIELAKRADFFGDVIREYVRNHGDGYQISTTHETERRGMGNHNNSKNQGAPKYSVLEYWGYLSGKELTMAGVEIPEDEMELTHAATVWVLDNVVIKAQRDPYAPEAKMYHQFVFEEDDVDLCGRGLPPIMRDSQMSVSNATRMMLDNASVVCGPQVEVDYEKLSPTMDNTSIHAFKTWLVEKPAGHSGAVVNSISFDSHIPDLMTIIKTFMDFADMETFVGPLTGGDMGDMPSEPLRTTGGMSMAMSNAALPFRDIVRNFDRFTISVIQSLVKWNKLFMFDESIDGDARPIARGATALMAREMRAAILDNLAVTLTEEDKRFIDGKALLKHRLRSRDLPLDDILLPDEVAQQNVDAAQQAEQEAAEQNRRMVEEQLKTMAAERLKDTTQAQKNLDAGDTQVARLILDALTQGVNPDVIASYFDQGTAETFGGNPEGDVLPPGDAGGVPDQAVPPGAPGEMQIPVA